MRQYDVVILGNGIVSKSLALALSQYGISTLRIAEAFPEYPNDPRSYAIAPSSLNLFHALGLEFPERMRVNRVELAFGEDLNEKIYALDKSGDMFSMIDHRDINAALDEALDSDWVDADASVFEFEEFKVALPEMEAEAQLLVIAEGKYSQNLARLGFGFSDYDFDQRAIAAKLSCEKPHDGVARQLFQNTGPLALLPFEEKGLSIVWSQKADMAQALMDISDDEFADVLYDKIGNYYGQLALLTPRASFPLRNSIADRLVQSRVALVGDSAHVLHPIAGQGLNLGLRDVACLSESLRKAKRLGLDLGSSSILDEYANWRKGDIARLDALTKAMNSVTQSENMAVNAVFNVSKTGLDIGVLRNWFAKMSDAGLEPQPPLLDGKLR